MNTYKYSDYDYNINKKKILNILIIDDDINVCTSLKLFLESRGHLITTVQEGIRGISHFDNNLYDLLFIDFHLDNDVAPNINKDNLNYVLDGSMVSELILNLKTNKKIIFGYTGDTSNIIINKFKDAGITGIIFKPFDPLILSKLMNIIETTSDINSLNNISKFKRNNILIFNNI
jgi:CheY-like chemotaxis protein